MSTKKHIDAADVAGEVVTDNFDEVYVPPKQEIENVQGVSGNAADPYYDALKFNEEVIEVMLHESTDEKAENPVYTACNGVSQYFFRGQVQAVKRKFVAILAAAKEMKVETPEYTAADGSRANSLRKISSLKYPFSVINDPNPRGAAWLKALLHSPT